jgi:hypothetical protein
MKRISRQLLSLVLPSISFVLVSCGGKTESNSEINTVVGRGGAFFDRRVQVINALPDATGQNACLYVSEFKRNEAAVFSGTRPLNQEQKDFLQRAERESKPVTLYPVSIADLDRELSEKENLRRLRGGLIVPLGIGASVIGFGIVGAALAPLCPGCFWGGMTIGQVLTNPAALGFLGWGLGGLGLLSQASRDLNSKNKGVRVEQAFANSSSSPASTNLGVTIAFVNAAKLLPAASKNACPADLTAGSVKPYFESLAHAYASKSDFERSRNSEDALAQLKNSSGCFFSADTGNEKLIYKVLPIDNAQSTLNVQTYSVKADAGTELIADEELKLQLSSDAGAGRKYIADNQRGSLALWIESSGGKSEAVEARLSHKFPNGEYAGGRTQLSGQCRL